MNPTSPNDSRDPGRSFEPATPGPIFIIGSPRSGTSILAWCLGQHPNLLPLEESNWMAQFAVDEVARQKEVIAKLRSELQRKEERLRQLRSKSSGRKAGARKSSQR